MSKVTGVDGTEVHSVRLTAEEAGSRTRVGTGAVRLPSRWISERLTASRLGWRGKRFGGAHEC